ncbi:glutamyl-tRNA amidotransferase [Vibrio vulnificus]|uniref:allophanate hydrolase-related protein n=1 Tax=Vibrio vulnificus TaxID=672 RepID=UPI001DA1AB02|nr:glutamyl-tRNA amidotransferase [Vibrio vulnificus]EGR0233371.1 glutamyl-tRNA amidotransferase [Vibrio vulnificus]ELV8621557.1 glutamyl-tRNA amidotransferase [Vibrio vulnificus]ELV8737732.1 glutamyl-tRNA amidotransferase [Vibrio vulnificus]MCG6274045.1 glutamyl-tRNA amidotransferase [Vibrio vulnificus]MCU8486473.1 glutamyl-tRNA amidotransferase [Vibrio vulnificus]
MSTETTLLAVNGTLMRGLKLNHNLLNVGAEFVREDVTDKHYRLWSINDDHPAMIRTIEESNSVDLEIWALPMAAFATVLSNEPAGLSIGKVKLADGSEILGVLGEPCLVEGQKEITHTGGWRKYTEALS